MMVTPEKEVKSQSVGHSVMSDSFWDLWTITHQAPLSMEFSRQEYWKPLPSPGDLPDPGVEPGSPALQADFFFYHLSHQGSPMMVASSRLQNHFRSWSSVGCYSPKAQAMKAKVPKLWIMGLGMLLSLVPPDKGTWVSLVGIILAFLGTLYLNG